MIMECMDEGLEWLGVGVGRDTENRNETVYDKKLFFFLRICCYT